MGLQWGIKTVLGIPVASPNVGRVIVVLYSIYNREKCENLVTKLKNEFTNLLPTPKWKLVVDPIALQQSSLNTQQNAVQQMQQHSAESQVQQFLQDRSYLPTQANTQIPAMNLMASPYEGPFQAPTKLPISMSETLPYPK